MEESPYVVTGLTSGDPYYFAVLAVNEHGIVPSGMKSSNTRVKHKYWRNKMNSVKMQCQMIVYLPLVAIH